MILKQFYNELKKYSYYNQSAKEKLTFFFKFWNVQSRMNNHMTVNNLIFMIQTDTNRKNI